MSSWLRRTHLPTWQGVREASGVKQLRTGGTHPSRPPLCSGRPGAVAARGVGWQGAVRTGCVVRGVGGVGAGQRRAGRAFFLKISGVSRISFCAERGRGARWARGEVKGRGGGARSRGGARRGGALAGSGRLGLGAGARRHAGRARTAASRLAGESRFGLASIEMVEMRMDCQRDTRRVSAREVGGRGGCEVGVARMAVAAGRWRGRASTVWMGSQRSDAFS